MDEKIAISTSVADDSNASNCDKGEKELKEKSELMFEIQTICEMDHCGILKDTPLTFSVQVYSKDSENSFPIDTRVSNMVPEPSMNENSIDHSSYPVDKDHEMNSYVPLKQTEINFKESRDTNTEQDAEELLLTRMSEITDYNEGDDNTQKRCSVQYESQNTDSSDCNLLDESKRSCRRSSKRKKDFDGFCPICGVTVRLNDLESHYNQEVERLSKIPRCSKKMHLEEVHKNEAFDLVRNNRENRLTARVARYSARAKSEVKCPVCSLRMSGTAEEINKHVAFCIQDEDSDVNVDGDDDDGTESFEEYEIGDETRIRPISLVPGGYRSLHGDSVRQTAEDEDLNVDVDDTIAYGDPQYSEIDVIPNTSCEEDRLNLEQLRKAVAIDTSARAQNLECHKWSKTAPDAENAEVTNSSSSSGSLTNSDPVISSLKEKIKTLEDQDKSVRCLICLESYTKPVVSTTCWHVHCEECWLMTMGVKKLCPQCNMIVFPSDLRKIYL